MARIPHVVSPRMIGGLEHLSSGKVRDIYRIGSVSQLLEVASDRISIFDLVLPTEVPFKGEILTALNIFWRTQVLAQSCLHDLVAFGSEIDQHLPEELRGNPALQKRAVVITRLAMVPIEFVVRGYLTGSGWESYQQSGMVCGQPLPPSFKNGSRLAAPLFTPTTKADSGHDLPLSPGEVSQKFGPRPEEMALEIYKLGRDYAESRGIILADTKFEFGFRPGQSLTKNRDFNFILADEVLTPDSSRYWGLLEWQKAQARGSLPPSLDKQVVRDWGKTHQIQELSPENPDHLEMIDNLRVPHEVLLWTTKIYRYIFWRLTSMKLEQFQRKVMGINCPPEPVKLDLVVGSESDLPQVQPAIDWLNGEIAVGKVQPRFHIISCHRHPEELRRYAEKLHVDVVVAAAGKAAALPGVLKAWLNHFGRINIPVIGVGLDGQDEADKLAARLSIEQLPGKPVLLNGEGEAYYGPEGMVAACRAAVEHEFLPIKKGPVKPAKQDMPIWAN